jgi:hypothetical protein
MLPATGIVNTLGPTKSSPAKRCLSREVNKPMSMSKKSSLMAMLYVKMTLLECSFSIKGKRPHSLSIKTQFLAGRLFRLI